MQLFEVINRFVSWVLKLQWLRKLGIANLDNTPTSLKGGFAILWVIIDKVTLFHTRHACFFFRFFKHFWEWFARPEAGQVVTIGNPLEVFLNSENLDHTTGMSDVSVGEEP